MARVPLFALGKQGKSVTVSSQQLINLFPEISEKPDRSILALYRTPGLLEKLDVGDTPFRGVHPIGNLLYAVHRGVFWEINNAFVKTKRGTITTVSGQVGIADNGNQVMIVDGVNGWIFNRTTLAFTQITSANFPNGASVCVFVDSFFLVDDPTNPGRFFKSATFNGLTWAALDFATAEYSEDGLVNIFPHQGYVGLLGETTIEAWQNVGSDGFPYRRVSGAVIEWGLAAKFSIAKYDNSFMFLAKNRLGGTQVVLIENFLPKVVSGPDFDAELSSYSITSDAVAFSYFQSGHSFYHISFPTAGKSWIYDLKSDHWSEVRSGTGQHRPALGVFFVDKNVVSDYENGKLYEFSDKYSDNNGDIMACEIVSKHLFSENRQSIKSLWLDIQPGAGTTGMSNPQVVLTISRDGGHSFGVGLPAAMGKIGEYLARCKWSRLGRARDWVFRFRITNRAKFVVTGAWLNTQYP